MPGLAFTPDRKQLVTARNDEGRVRVFAVSNGKPIRDFVYDSNLGGLAGAAIESFGVSADGKRLVIHRYESPDIAGLALFDLATGKELARHRLSDKAVVRFSAPSPDGRHLFYAKENAVHMMDVKTGNEIRRFDIIGESVGALACSLDGKYVVAGVQEDRESCIQCWDVATGKAVQTIKGKGGVGPPMFSPDGRSILTTFSDTTARLWHLEKDGLQVDTTQLWEAIADGDKAKAKKAMVQFVGKPNETIAFVKGRLPRLQPVPAKEIQDLISAMTHAEFNHRVKAQFDLEMLQELGAPELRKALAATTDEELAARTERLLAKVAPGRLAPNSERMRWLRAIEVLEQIGTPDAIALLRALADGAPGLRLVDEAQAALGRLKVK